MLNRRQQAWYVAIAWVLALASISVFYYAGWMGRAWAGDGIGGAPTGDDYKHGCYSILLYMAAFTMMLAAITWSLVGFFLVRSMWVVACALSLVATVAPWILMQSKETVIRTATESSFRRFNRR